MRSQRVRYDWVTERTTHSQSFGLTTFYFCWDSHLLGPAYFWWVQGKVCVSVTWSGSWIVGKSPEAQHIFLASVRLTLRFEHLPSVRCCWRYRDKLDAHPCPPAVLQWIFPVMPQSNCCSLGGEQSALRPHFLLILSLNECCCADSLELWSPFHRYYWGMRVQQHFSPKSVMTQHWVKLFVYPSKLKALAVKNCVLLISCYPQSESWHRKRI